MRSVPIRRLLLVAATLAIALCAPAVATASTPLPSPAGAQLIPFPPPDPPLPPFPAPPPLRSGLVVTVDFLGSGSTPASQADQTTSRIAQFIREGVNPWFAKASNGRFPGFSTLRIGPVKVAPQSRLCSSAWLDEVADLADAQVRRQRVEPDDVTTVFYYFRKLSPAQGCDWGGRGEQPSTVPGRGHHVWLNGDFSGSTLVHEIGHTLGLGHAGAQFCRDSSGNDVPLSAPLGSRCTQDEYGNAFSAMGSVVGFLQPYSFPHLLQLGWNNGRVDTIAAGAPPQTRVLTTLDHAVPGSTQALRLTDGFTTLWLEYRIGSGPTHGALLVSAEQPSLAGGRNVAPFVLDMSPQDADDTRSQGSPTSLAMSVGQAWSNPLGHMTIALNAADADQATVTVQSAPDPAPDPGPGDVVVPSVLHATPPVAQSRLVAAGLVRGTLATKVDPLCESLGEIIAQAPVAGIVVPHGAAVDLKVAVQPPRGCPVSAP